MASLCEQKLVRHMCPTEDGVSSGSDQGVRVVETDLGARSGT